MYIDQWTFWIVIILVVLYIAWKTDSTNQRINKILHDDEPLYKKDHCLSKRLREVEKWLDFYHPIRDIEERDKFFAWQESSRIAKSWAKARKMSKEETEKYLKNYKKQWEKEYKANKGLSL